MSFGDEDDELNCTLWVGNVDPKVTEAILFEIFAQAGAIEKIHIPKGKDGHKGYCFITFQRNESVPYTIVNMEGTTLCGKILKLQPRPGSKHKKAMDAAKEGEQQRLLLQQQMQHQQSQIQVPMPVPQNIHGPAQWFIAPPQPQMAQFQNPLLYPNQLQYPQPFHPNFTNLNAAIHPAIIQLPPGIQLIPIPVPPQQVQGASPVQPHQPLLHENHVNYHPRGPWPSGNDFRQPRPPKASLNGFATTTTTTTYRQLNGNSAQAQAPSQYSQSQVLKGSQPQSPRFLNRWPRPHIARPQQSQQQHSVSPRNTNSNNNVNGNSSRPPFSHRSPAPAPAFQPSPPLYPTHYHHQSPSPAAGTPLQFQSDRQQYFQRPPFQAGNVFPY